MNTMKVTALLVSTALLASTMSGCATDEIGEEDENVEDDEFYGYGVMLPGPDYAAADDPSYDFVVATQGGPQTPEDWATLDELELALDEAARETWVQLPGWISTEFPELTEAERNQLISDFQDAVAVAQVMRDDPYSAECVEMYVEDPDTGQVDWIPVCDSDFGPDFEQRLGKIVRWVVQKSEAGRQAVRAAAGYVGRVATNAYQGARQVAGQVAERVRTVAGQVAQNVKAGAAAIAMRAGQVWMWAKENAAKGWKFVKEKWVDWVVAGAVGGFIGQPGADLYNYLKKNLFGGETSTTTTTTPLLLGDENGNVNLDVLFDM
jgi:hypothetical protein